MRRIWLLFFALLPSRCKIFILRRQGHQIGERVRIGMSYLDIAQFKLGNDVRIGNFNYFKNLRLLEMHDGATTGGSFGWFTAPALNNGNNPGFGVLRMHRRARITGLHYIDLSDTVTVGEESRVAGMRSTFFTHGTTPDDTNRNLPITIGRRCYIGTNAIFLPGAVIGDYTFVGAGSVVSKDFSKESYVLIVGNPAEVKHPYSPDREYFTRSKSSSPAE